MTATAAPPSADLGELADVVGGARAHARVGRGRVGVGAVRRPTWCSRRRSRTACSSTSRRRSRLDIEVVFLDTQYHFAETLWYVEEIRERYDLNLTVMRPADPARRPLAGRPRRAAARMRKVEPLARALEGKGRG